MLFVAIAFFSPLLVVAVPESVIAGPYIVSFDIGEPNNEHDIFTKGPEEKEELSGVKRIDYGVSIIRNSSMFLDEGKTDDLLKFANIYMITFSQSMTKIPSYALEEQLRTRLESVEGNINIQTSPRIIDERQGAIASYGIEQISYGENKFPPLEAYCAIYQPVFDNGFSMIYIDSNYPWKETSKLLNTLHIEKSNPAEKSGWIYVSPANITSAIS
jgi:hypothetical protein